MGRKTCFYDLLAIGFAATSDEVKRAFRRQALLFHPDRCRDLTPDEAKKRFQAINEAYETLSNPQERAWYDGHRDEILGGTADEQAGSGQGFVNIWPFFSRTCFEAFDDKPKGFFSVYCQLFERIDAQDIQWSSRTKARPSFGGASSSWPLVGDFFQTWEAFSSSATFAHAAVWRLSDAPNRDVRRVMEQENKKAIGKARREYSESVRRLVEWVKRRDPRVLEMQRQAILKAQQAAEEAELEKARREAELAEGRALAREQELKRFEERRAERAELKAAGQVFLDSSDESDGEEKESMERFACKACRKEFKSIAQMAEHHKSRKHLQTCRKLRIEPAMDERLAAALKGLSGRCSDLDEPPASARSAEVSVRRGSSPICNNRVANDVSSSDENATSIVASSNSVASSSEKRSVASGMIGGTEQELRDDSSASEEDFMNVISFVKADKERGVADEGFEGESLANEKPIGQGSRPAKVQRRRRAKAAAGAAPLWKCLICSSTFHTRNQLMHHVNNEGHAAPRSEALKQAGGKKRR